VGFDFEKLNVYKRGVQFILKVYEATEKFPQDELYGLTGQLRRAAKSLYRCAEQVVPTIIG